MTSWIEKKSIIMTKWIGTPTSLVVHTFVFALAFILPFFGIFSIDEILLALTTLVSLEAIYLAIFIQMTVNRQAGQIEEVSEDVEEIQEEVGGLGKDVEEISKDVEEIAEDIDKIQEEQHVEGGLDEEKTRVAPNLSESNIRRITEKIKGIKSRFNNRTD
jgi:low affinity Fe/Cu permease